jgi:hypothetical protein
MVNIETLPYYRNSPDSNVWNKYTIETYTTLHYSGIETERIWDLVLLYAEVKCDERPLLRMVYDE